MVDDTRKEPKHSCRLGILLIGFTYRID